MLSDYVSINIKCGSGGSGAIDYKDSQEKAKPSGGNGGNGGTSEVYLAADVRKMPGGGFGVYADKFVKGKRVTLPSGKHQKELKKVYKNKKEI